MKERPILFSAPMVRALLDGSKKQTRRVVKPQPYRDDYMADGDVRRQFATLSPYGQPGGRLWVRESTHRRPMLNFLTGEPLAPQYDGGAYSADGADVLSLENFDIAWWYSRRSCPSIHMPRWASRILLEIVSVRVERLNDCSEADAKAEGVMQLDADDCPRPETRTKEGWSLCPTCAGTGLCSTLGAGGGVNFDVDCTDCDTHLKLYRHLWEAINGAGSWDANPWVWRVEFSRVTP